LNFHASWSLVLDATRIIASNTCLTRTGLDAKPAKRAKQFPASEETQGNVSTPGLYMVLGWSGQSWRLAMRIDAKVRQATGQQSFIFRERAATGRHRLPGAAARNGLRISRNPLRLTTQ
jgi:hypothetical protein